MPGGGTEPFPVLPGRVFAVELLRGSAEVPECLCVPAWPAALVQGSRGLFLGTACPGSCQLQEGQGPARDLLPVLRRMLQEGRAGHRRDRDLLPFFGRCSRQDTGGTGTCCLLFWRMLQEGKTLLLVSGSPCSVLSWPGASHGSSSRLGVPGQVLRKGWWPFGLASCTGLPLHWGRVLAHRCLSSQEGSRKVLGRAGAAQSRVGAHGAGQVLGASRSPSHLPRPPPAAQAAPGLLCLLQPSLGGRGSVLLLLLEICAPMSPWIPLGFGAGAGNSGLQQYPDRAALAARVQGTWLGGSWGLSVSPDSSCSAAGRSTWSCPEFGEVCTCQGSSHPRLSQEGPAWVPPWPSPEHSHHRESPGMSQSSPQSWGRAGFEQVLPLVSIISVPIRGLHPCPCMRVTPWLSGGNKALSIFGSSR